jgi:hypothetical protein
MSLTYLSVSLCQYVAVGCRCILSLGHLDKSAFTVVLYSRLFPILSCCVVCIQSASQHGGVFSPAAKSFHRVVRKTDVNLLTTGNYVHQSLVKCEM